MSLDDHADNILKYELNVNDSSYLAVNTLSFHCTEQSFDAVQKYSGCAFSKATLKYTG
jgi:hypothetical protein